MTNCSLFVRAILPLLTYEIALRDLSLCVRHQRLVCTIAAFKVTFRHLLYVVLFIPQVRAGNFDVIATRDPDTLSIR